MLRAGIDLMEIERIRQAIDRFGERFLMRVFTANERAVCRGRVESLAGRFAAKEAAAKALGTGVWREGIDWTDIEVLRGEAGEPILALHGSAARRAAHLGLREWSLSISHDRRQAIAIVVAR